MYKVFREDGEPDAYLDQKAGESFLARHRFDVFDRSESAYQLSRWLMLADGSVWYEIRATAASVYRGYELRRDLTPTARIRTALRAFDLAEERRRCGLQDEAEITRRARFVCELISSIVSQTAAGTALRNTFARERLDRIADGKSGATFESLALLGRELFNTGALGSFGLGTTYEGSDLKDVITFHWREVDHWTVPFARVEPLIWRKDRERWDDLPPFLIRLDSYEVI